MFTNIATGNLTDFKDSEDINDDELKHEEKTSFELKGEKKKTISHDTPETLTVSELEDKKATNNLEAETSENISFEYKQVPSLYYREYRRAPLLDHMKESWKNFGMHLGEPEGAYYYSEIKKSLELIWNYISIHQDDELVKALNIFTACTKRRWTEWNSDLFNKVSGTVESILNENVKERENERAILLLEQNGISPFPEERDAA